MVGHVGLRDYGTGKSENDGTGTVPYHIGTPYPSKRQKKSSDELSLPSVQTVRPTTATTASTEERSVTELANATTNDRPKAKQNIIEIEATNFTNNKSVGASDGVAVDAEEKDIKEWDEFVLQSQDELAIDPIVRGILDIFLRGKASCENAKHNLASSLEQCNSRLESYVESFVQEIAAPIHSGERESLDALEADIKEHFVRNHARRTEFQKSMDDFNNAWKSVCSNLMANLNNDQNPLSPVTKDITKESKSDKTEDEALDENDEPNWELLAEYKESGESIQLFLNGRERIQSAEDIFASALDRIHASLRHYVESMVSIVVEIYQTQEGAMDISETDIQNNMILNFKRAVGLRMMLEESAKQTQSAHSNLLSLLVPSSYSSQT